MDSWKDPEPERGLKLPETTLIHRLSTVIYSLSQLDEEMALGRKLQSLGLPDPFKGSTTLKGRMEQVRGLIAKHQLQEVLFTVSNGKHVTLADQFRKAYLETV